MTHPNVISAIRRIYPDKGFTIQSSDTATLLFQDGTPNPSDLEISEMLKFMEAEHAAVAYRAQRAAAYPSIGDQLDALFKAGVFPDDMEAKIQAVKDQFPKPTA